ncbi:MAG TPA: asparagine synthase (glutamine-hydrolyzing) [Bryobacteraceae bacterium]|nr:asparagine synthase (glutamine-hydrolyzing) [Bryobacteraceae bacterium]
MCGIAGYISAASRPETAVVRAMCDAIRHRGPDDEGFHVEGPCGMGMRRLSIIDLATGHQPMSNEDGSIWLVFNGEIYSYQELRRNLIAQGHRFQTNSDTETIIHLYEQEGPAGIAKLRGMFAFAIWDRNREKLLVARDRFGKKPLYYVNTTGGFYFASELKCLRAAGVPLEIDREALKLYLQFGYIPDPWTAFEGVKKLTPGFWMTVDLRGREETGRYWQLPPPREKEISRSHDEVCRDIRAVFDESVRLRMIADVPLGAFLSGGIDSSLVVASMARQSDQPIRTFSIGFEEEGKYNELPYARVVAEHYKTDHHELIVRPNALDLIPHLIRYFDEPFADSSAIPTYLVSQFAAEHVKVALSGDGGDELFGGYHSFFEVEKLSRYDAIPQVGRRALGALAAALPYSAYGKNFLYSLSRPHALERYFEYISFNSYSLRKQVLMPEWLNPPGMDFLRATFGDSILPDEYDCMSQAMYFEATSKLTGDILVKVDRMSMANSLEVRCPLLDQELAELANSIPNSWKTRGGKGKLILLEALSSTLPAELLNRPKRGFSVPLDLWFQGPLRAYVGDNLKSKRFLERGIVSEPHLDAMLAEHWSGRRLNSGFIWLLLVLELWLSELESPMAADSCYVPAAGAILNA